MTAHKKHTLSTDVDDYDDFACCEQFDLLNKKWWLQITNDRLLTVLYILFMSEIFQ